MSRSTLSDEEVKRLQSRDTGSPESDVWASARTSRATAYHDDRDCPYIRHRSNVRKRTRKVSQLAWLTPCLHCVLPGDNSRSLEEVLRA